MYRLRWIELVTYSAFFVFSLLWLLPFTNWSAPADWIRVGVTLVLAAVLLVSYVSLLINVKIFRKIIWDELFGRNELMSAFMTFWIMCAMLVIVMIIGYFNYNRIPSYNFQITVLQIMELAHGIVSALMFIKAGIYLYLERTGISNAGIDDED